MNRKIALRLTAISLIAACGGIDTGSSVDEANQMPYAEGSPEAIAVVAVANDTSLGVEEFDSNEYVGLHKKAAENIVKHRDGEDLESIEDDNPFDNATELYGVSYCKKTCFEQLLAYAKDTGVYGENVNDDISVIFSPQAPDATHLVKIAEQIDGAEETIDIAMYSYSDQNPVKGALQRAVDRGVTIRFLANKDLANSASKGGALEEMGIDVRRTTKVMHHKLAIIDGPRDSASHDLAATARIVSGSANWSGSAGTKYDENTLFYSGYAELALRFQRDFDSLWAGSKDKVWNDQLVWDQTSADITDEDIAEVEDPNSHVYFTSWNFTHNGGGSWGTTGTTVVTDAMVAAILSDDTTESIHVASGHFLNVPLAEAIVQAQEDHPDIEVDIVLDCQEATKSGDIYTLKKEIEDNGGTILYKCNTYRWHYTFAAQMHHKYIVLDGEELFTGSMNFSPNAETNVFENMMQFKGAEHQMLVDSYLDNHAMVKNYGRDDNMAALTDLREEIETSYKVPLTWSTPISMDLDDFKSLKTLIRNECPATDAYANTGESLTYKAYFSSQAHWFKACHKSGYAWPSVPESMRVADPE